MLAVPRAEGQTTLIGAVNIDAVKIKAATFLATENNPVTLRTPGGRSVVLAPGGQTGRLAGKDVGNKDVWVTLTIGDKSQAAAIRTPGRITVNPPVVGNALADPTIDADQVDFRVAVRAISREFGAMRPATLSPDL